MAWTRCAATLTTALALWAQVPGLQSLSPTATLHGLQVHVLVRKVRNKAAGTIGDCTLHYERVNGRYLDPDFLSAPGIPRTAQRMEWDRRDPTPHPGGGSPPPLRGEARAPQAARTWGPDGTVSCDPVTPTQEAAAWRA